MTTFQEKKSMLIEKAYPELKAAYKKGDLDLYERMADIYADIALDVFRELEDEDIGGIFGDEDACILLPYRVLQKRFKFFQDQGIDPEPYIRDRRFWNNGDMIAALALFLKLKNNQDKNIEV
jgi:hypothetical protein